MIRAVIYCRCSTEEECQRDALIRQAAEARECVRRLNWFLADEYIESKSGTSTRRREEYQRLFTDLLRDKFEIVVVKSQDRLMRNTRDWYLFIDRLVTGGKRLYLYLENRFYSTDDALITGIKAILAEEYSRELSRKINNAHQNRQKKGNALMITSNIYGYRKLADKTFAVIEEEAKIKRKMYQLCAAGFGSRTIARILRQEGVQKRNGSSFSDSDIRRMIRNPINKGTVVMNRKHYDFDTRQTVKNSEEQLYIFENRFPSIVSKELWEAANQAIDKRRNSISKSNMKQSMSRKSGINRGQYALSGKMICGLCGAPFYRAARKRKQDKVYEWKCRTYLEQGRKKEGREGGCENIYLEENGFLLMLGDWACKNYVLGQEERILRIFLKLLKESLKEIRQEKQESCLQYEKKLYRQQSLLLEKYLEGMIETPLYNEKQRDLQRKLQEQKARSLLNENNKKTSIDEAEARLEKIRRFLLQNQAFSKACALCILEAVEKITVFPEKTEVFLNLCGHRGLCYTTNQTQPIYFQSNEMKKIDRKGHKTMNIRKSIPEDLPQILNLYKLAREFMKNNGNPNQWEDRYPEVSTVENDVKQGISYVCEKNGKIVGTFVFFIGEDPTYHVIENGAWHSSQKPYGVIHRVASDGQTKGVTCAAFTFGMEKSGYLRIDTHQDNKPMQGALKKFGFQECGIIHLERGDERIAFDCLKG